MSTSKEKRAVHKRLTSLNYGHVPGRCWVCNSRFGLKTSRESYGRRCQKCFDAGKTTKDVIEYDQLCERLTKLNTQKS